MKIQVYVVEPLIVIRRQFVSKCTSPDKRSNSIICESPYVCNNEDSVEIRRTTHFEIFTQAYISICWCELKMVYSGSQGLVPPICIYDIISLARTPEIGQGLGRILSCGARKPEQTSMDL